MPESFTVVLSTRNSNAIDSSNLYYVLFYVNWPSILPKNYEKFQCKFTFYSEYFNTGAYAFNPYTTGYLSIDFGRNKISDGLQKSNRIGSIVMSYTFDNNGTNSEFFYFANNQNNNPFCMDYPNNNNIRVTVFDDDGSMTGVLNGLSAWCLTLTFTPIIEYKLSTFNIYSMKETYTVIFCTRNSNVINNSNILAYQYLVNWEALIPKKYTKYRCEFIFKSEVTQVTYQQVYVTMNFGSMNIYDGLQKYTRLGVILNNTINNTNNMFYSASNQDNNPFTINYPTNNIITVSLNSFDGTALTGMVNYCLTLNMTPIDDDELIGF